MNILALRKSLRVLPIAIFTFVTIGSVSTALAAPPFKAYFGPIQGLTFNVGSCGSFDILNDYMIEGFFIVHFDKDGNLKHVNQHISYSDSTYTNSVDQNMQIDGGPGEGESQRYDYTGDQPVVAVSGVQFKITLPGYGIILHEVGRTIFDEETFEVLWQAGPADVTEQNLAALCAALTP